MTQPSFSVVIPLFNKGPHVRAAVESALAQSLAPLEVLVVDDGSTDDGPVSLQAIDDSRLRLLSRSPPGPGGYAARNLGIAEAAGDWIAFLDADDLWAPNHLESLADAIRAGGETVGCAFSGAELVYPGRRTPRVRSRLLDAHRVLDAETMLRAWLDTGECPLWTGAIAMRRKLLESAGGFPEGRTRRGGDKDLWLHAILRTDCVYSGGATAEFHQETVNRVSNLTPHFDLPILAETIRGIIPHAPRRLVPLLRRLSNLEIALYARYAAGRGGPVLGRFARALYWPEGATALARMLAYFPAGLLRGIIRR